ncbi:MAG TPA: hypothetical protein VE075_07145 [Thermoanaerobaculia bacterium]|nr:hypothetical protein [Thermoanaerobaculia bacterium]
MAPFPSDPAASPGDGATAAAIPGEPEALRDGTTAGGLPAAPGFEAAERNSRRALLALLAAMAAWSAWFIGRSSFVVSGRRIFCLFEDAMISMTYARSLVEGHGLNWARMGRPVEGFTHPLWVALMVPINALPLDPRFRSLPVQLLSLAILGLHVVLVRRVTLRFFATAGARHWLPAALLTAFYYPLSYWSLMGLESGLQALLTTASVLLALDVVCRGEDRHRALLLLGAAAYLLRMDMVLMVLVVQLYVIAGGGLREPRQRVSWLQGAAMFAALAAGYSVFRWITFGDLLPNTYYLKLYRIPLAVRLLRGSRSLWESLADHLPLLAVTGAGVGVLLRHHPDRGWRRRLLLPASLVLTAFAYSVYVGGDAYEMLLNVRANRFTAYVMPQVFILFNALINEASARMPRLAGRRLAAAAAVLALVSADGLWLAADAAGNRRDLAVTRPPWTTAGQAAVYRAMIRLRDEIAPGSVVATACAGIPAYFSDFRMVDELGYSDRHIARLPPALPLGPDDYQLFQPGHVKWDVAYVLARRPAAIVRCVGGGRFGDGRLLREAGYRYDASGLVLLGPSVSP